MDQMQPQPLVADVEDGRVILDGRGIVATLTAADAAKTADALAKAASDASRPNGTAQDTAPAARQRWSDDLEA